MFSPTPYKISTITATGHVNSPVNLSSFYQNLSLSEPPKQGIHYVELGSTLCRGVARKSKNKRTPTVKKFDNQATVLLYLNGFFANCKVFKNGCIQLTGLRKIEHGTMFINYIIDEIRRIKNTMDDSIVDDPDALKIDNYRVRLINTDFNAGIEVRRDSFFQYMLQTYPEMYTVFEPCIYSGVKIHYYHNDKCGVGDGICRCVLPCNGKGRGHGEGDCKKITIAVFMSGCVLVTGGSEYKQIDDAYEFTCNVMRKCENDIRKEITVVPEAPKKRLLKKKC